jgi:hypothetical protein
MAIGDQIIAPSSHKITIGVKNDNRRGTSLQHVNTLIRGDGKGADKALRHVFRPSGPVAINSINIFTKGNPLWFRARNRHHYPPPKGLHRVMSMTDRAAKDSSDHEKRPDKCRAVDHSRQFSAV